MIPNFSQVKEFLGESNAIESVYDTDSFTQAYLAWEYLTTHKTLTLGIILETHRILMKNQDLKDNEKGYFRKIPIYIGGRMGIDASEIEHDLSHWIEEMNQNHIGGDMAMTKVLHVKYEKIHPFVDGNGRTGRMFMNWWRLKNNLPLLIIHEGKEQMEYYKWFK